MSEIELSVTLVINRCAGGYGLSRAAATELARRKGLELFSPVEGEDFLNVVGSHERIEDLVRRDDPDLVAVVRAMGNGANAPSADLRVVELPITVEVESLDGMEELSVVGGGFST